MNDFFHFEGQNSKNKYLNYIECITIIFKYHINHSISYIIYNLKLSKIVKNIYSTIFHNVLFEEKVRSDPLDSNKYRLELIKNKLLICALLDHNGINQFSRVLS